MSKLDNDVADMLKDILPAPTGIYSSTDMVKTPIDGEFDVNAYIDSRFQDASSLEHADKALEALDKESQYIGSEIVLLLHQQQQNRRKTNLLLNDAAQSMSDLKSSVLAFEKLANLGHSAGKPITEEVSGLHKVKTGVASLIKKLQKATIVADSLQILQTKLHEKDYKKVASLIQVINEHRRDSSLVDFPFCKELQEQVSFCFDDICTTLLEEFDILFDADSTTSPDLIHICKVMECLSIKVVGDIVKTLVSSYIDSYIDSFKETGITSLKKRFSWLRMAMKGYEEDFDDKYISKSWGVKFHIAHRFVVVTYEQLSEALSLLKTELSHDRLEALMKQAFESESSLCTLFEDEKSELVDLVDLSECDDPFFVPYDPKVFLNSVSKALFNNIGPWIEVERNAMNKELGEFKKNVVIIRNDKLDNDHEGVFLPGNSEPTSIYGGVADMFVYLSSLIEAKSKISNSIPLQTLYEVATKNVISYVEELEKIAEKSKTIQDWTAVIGSLDYIDNTVKDLDANIVQCAHDDIKDHISMNIDLLPDVMKVRNIVMGKIIETVRQSTGSAVNKSLIGQWQHIRKMKNESNLDGAKTDKENMANIRSNLHNVIDKITCSLNTTTASFIVEQIIKAAFTELAAGIELREKDIKASVSWQKGFQHYINELALIMDEVVRDLLGHNLDIINKKQEETTDLLYKAMQP